jgi:hypothetical protein
MNLGYALNAVDSYYKAGDEREVRDRTAKRFDWEEQKAQSELALLADRQAADQAEYRLRAKQKTADLGLVDTNADTARIEAENRGTTARGKSAVIPLESQTSLNNAKVGAAKAQYEADNVANTLDDLAAKNIISREEQVDAVMGRLAKYINANDERGLLNFANSIAQKTNVLPGLNGKQVQGVAVKDGSDKQYSGKGYEFALSDGSTIFMTQQTIQDALTRVKGNPKLNFMHDKDTGEVLVGNEATGDVRVARAASRQNPTKDSRPAEVRLADYYISKGVPEDEAMRRASRLKDMSPANAEFQLYKDRIALNPNADEAAKQKIRQEVRKEVDEIFGARGTAQQSAPMPAGNAPLDPRIAQRIGLGQPSAPAPSPAPTISQTPAPAPAPAASPALSQAPTRPTNPNDPGEFYRQQVARLAEFNQDPRVAELRRQQQQFIRSGKPAQANAISDQINQIKQQYLQQKG